MWEAWLCQLEVVSRGIKRSWFEKEICESPDHKATQQDIFDKRCRDGKIVVIVMVTLCCGCQCHRAGGRQEETTVAPYLSQPARHLLARQICRSLPATAPQTTFTLLCHQFVTIWEQIPAPPVATLVYV